MPHPTRIHGWFLQNFPAVLWKQVVQMIGRDASPRPNRHAFRAEIERRRGRAQLATHVVGLGALEKALQLLAAVADADDEHAAGQVVERPTVPHARVARTLLRAA